MSACGCACGLGEKGDIYIYIIDNNKNKWCVACDCMQTCLGIRPHCITAEWHGLHGYSGVSVAHDLRMRVRLCACLCGIVDTYLCCHGLRCGSSSRRPGHGRPDSRSFSVSPCRRLRTRHETLKGIVRTFGNCPHGLRDWKREGLTACTRVGCALARKAAAPAVERVAAIFGNGLLNAFQNCKTNSRAGASTGNHNLQRNDAEKAPASSPLKRDGAAVLPADGGSEPCSFESTTP